MIPPLVVVIAVSCNLFLNSLQIQKTLDSKLESLILFKQIHQTVDDTNDFINIARILFEYELKFHCISLLFLTVPMLSPSTVSLYYHFDMVSLSIQSSKILSKYSCDKAIQSLSVGHPSRDH